VPDAASTPLPPDAVVLHIGPHKTGTTALQGALFHARNELRQHGAEYAGPGRSPYLAALYATGRRGRRGDPTPKAKHWNALRRKAERATNRRFVISSERFATPNRKAIRRIIDELGVDRVHVIVTLRPLAKILPSQWQQYVQNGLMTPYLDWLRAIFDERGTSPTGDFWARHDHARLIRRWSSVVGTDRTTVIVVDDEDHLMLMRSLEMLLDLPAGLLVPEGEQVNRSLTFGETEVIRLLNVEQAQRGWSAGDHRHFIRRGVVSGFKTRQPDRGEGIIETPRWAVERAKESATRSAEEIIRLGVRVVGDLGQLTRPPRVVVETDEDMSPALVPATAAAAGAVGAISAGLMSQATPDLSTADVDELARPLGNISTVDLAGVLAGRMRERVRRPMNR
jgi:hypothetical protein